MPRVLKQSQRAGVGELPSILSKSSPPEKPLLCSAPLHMLATVPFSLALHGGVGATGGH
jgi:hypothetical protein